MSRWFSAHTHSKYSVLDGMTNVEDLVGKAHDLGQPGLMLTDHGNGAGWVTLYKECKKFDMAPFPGCEMYLVDPDFSGDLGNPKEAKNLGRYHFGIAALDLQGYQALVKFVSKTHTRPNFSRFPRCTLSELIGFGKAYGEHVVITTGCYFGWVQQTLVKHGAAKAERIIKTLASVYPNLYIELQNHNIEHNEDDAVRVLTDDDIVVALYDIAQRLGLPVIATQDSHYCDYSQKKAHTLMKKMVYGGADDAFPGDSFHFASEEYMGDYYDRTVWEDVLEGMDDLLGKNKLSIPPLDKYKVHVPKIRDDPDEYIDTLCMKRLKKYLRKIGIDWGSNKAKEYKARLKEELYVIKKLGYASYFVLEEFCVKWCRTEKIAIEARGSANGSLVCFLLYITQVDPIIWNTRFDRFMSLDRIKPPDIDMDIEDVERPRLLTMIANNFDSLQIGTWAALGARVDDGRGSVMVTYEMYLRKFAAQQIAEWYPDLNVGEKKARAAAYYNKHYAHIKSMDDVKAHSMKDYRALIALSQLSVYRSYGTHAAGILVSGEGMNIDDWIPSMLVASSNTSVTQFDGDSVEEMGLLKMDWLGQATLRTMKLCQEMIGREDPTDFSWIPLEDKEALKLLRTGRTETGIFHFEGYTKAKGGREMGIKSVEDVVLAQALYMPGCMDVAPGQNISQKDLYLKRRNSAAERKKIKYLSPEFEDALKSTYGAVVFQEQVINIMRNLGMDIAGINKFFKVVKDSGKGAVERNHERMAEVRVEFDALCEKAGVDPDAAWGSTAAFVAYGFNRAHAAGYGIRSYRCAYLKAHHPLEFMCALLQTWAGRDKEKVYVREARRIEIRIKPAHVNDSGASWTLDRSGHGSIRRGLVTVMGIGEKTAIEIADKAPFTSVEDMIERCNGRAVTGGKVFKETGSLNSGTIGKLNAAGAIEGLPMTESKAERLAKVRRGPLNMNKKRIVKKKR